MNKKIIITKGLPASGKSTWAREYQAQFPNTVRVNKDDLRAMLHNSVWSRGREDFVLKVRDFIVAESLKEGHSVIIDDTNFAPKHEINLRDLAKSKGADFEVKDFSDVPLEVCIERDLKRANSVGKDVIVEMYEKYLKVRPEPIKYNSNLPDAVICDIDGTLALANGGNWYDRDFSKDLPNQPIVDIVSELLTRDYLTVFFVSGRKGKYRDQTVNWLNKYLLTDRKWVDEHLFMRKEDDDRKDFIIKKEIFDEHFKDKFNIKYVLDDRDQVVEFWRSLGLTCLQVANGNF